MSDVQRYDEQARRKELQDWRATLTKEEDETVARMIEQQGEEYVISILGHLKNQLEYVRGLQGTTKTDTR